MASSICSKAAKSGGGCCVEQKFLLLTFLTISNTPPGRVITSKKYSAVTLTGFTSNVPAARFLDDFSAGTRSARGHIPILPLEKTLPSGESCGTPITVRNMICGMCSLLGIFLAGSSSSTPLRSRRLVLILLIALNHFSSNSTYKKRT